MRARPVLLLAALAVLAAPAPAAEVEKDDPAARLRAMREWYGTDSLPRSSRILEAARRERDRYAMGASRTAAAVQAQAVGSNNAFVSVGPTRADFAVNGDEYHEIDSGRARQIVAHPSDPDVLYLATSGGGVWRTFNATSGNAVQWEPITDALGTMTVGALAMDPSNPDILFLGFGDPFDLQQPGITRSTDGGGTWSNPLPLQATYVFGPMTYPLTAGAVTDIKVDPRNSAVVLATTDVGLFRSTNGGASWSHIPLGATSTLFFYMWSLAFAGNDTWLVTGQSADITAPSTANSGGPLGLWRSTDDGATWTYAASALPGADTTARLAGRGTLATAQSTLVEPASARIYLLAGAADGRSQYDLFRSDDGGLSFQSLQVNSSRQPTNPNPNQTNLDIGSAQAWYNQALFVDPANPDTVFLGGQLSMARSMDAGRNWTLVSNWLPNNSENSSIVLSYVHADLHAFGVGADRTLYAGSDGGISASSNALSAPIGQVAFTSKRNEGLVSHLVYTVACAPESWPASQGFVVGGLQDNGTRLRAGDSTTFNQVLGGDGVGVAVSGGTHDLGGVQVPDIFLASVPGAVYRSFDGGQNFDQFTSGLAALPFFVRVARDGAAGDTFLTFSASPTRFYRWRSGEAAWVNVSGVLHWQDSNQDTQGFVTVDGGAPIALRNLTAHARVPDTWAAVSNRFTYMTSTGGARWLVGIQPKPPGSIAGVFLLSSVEFDWSDPSGKKYYVSTVAPALVDAANHFYEYPSDFGRVLRTLDGGLSWESLGVQGPPGTPGRLPDVGVGVIKVDPNDPAILYAGTELGLYRSADSGATWTRFGAGTLPLVEVRDLCISPGSQRLTAATYGRGFWQIDTAPAASPAGVRGLGDTNFDSRIDGEDLIDLADGFGATQSSPVYRWQADLVGTSNGIDQGDVDALLAKFGGRP